MSSSNLKQRFDFWWAICKEMSRYSRHRAPLYLTKMLVSRLRCGTRPTVFLSYAMQYQPFGTGADHMRFYDGAQAGLKTLNHARGGLPMAHDKLTMSHRFVSAGLASPPILAVIGRSETEPFPSATTPDALVQVLAEAPDKLLAKPGGRGGRGQGIIGLTRSGNGWLLDGTFYSVEGLAELLLAQAPEGGLLLQPRLTSHKAMAPIGGELGLGTLRMTTAFTEDGPEVVGVILKIMGTEQLTDHFSGGSAGHLIAALDLKTGRITEAFGRAAGDRYLVRKVSRHPVTAAYLPGFQLPMWRETMDFGMRLAAAIPETPLVGSDVAITDDGPVILEFNTTWATEFLEIATQRGIRSMLRDVVPRLALDEDLKGKAAKAMRL